MAIIEIDEIWSGRAGNWSVSEGRKYTRVFRAISNYAGDGPITAINSLGVLRGDPYITINESDPNAFVMDITASAEDPDNSLQWILTVNYGWYDVNEAGGGPEQNPLLMPIDVSWSFRDYDRVATTDLNGKPVLNTAGDPYDPPKTINIPNQMMVVVRNEAIYQTGYANLYRNSINSDSFGGASALFCKNTAITPKNIFHQDIGWYYQVTYEFEMLNPRNAADKYGWRSNLLDVGLRKLDVNGNLVPITLNGIPVTSPVLLDGVGHPLAVGGTPVYNQFQFFPELPFSEFNFDVAAISGLRTGFP